MEKPFQHQSSGSGLTGAQEVVLKRIRDIPSLPEVVNRIIQLLGEPNSPASEIARLISYDPGLTSKVLRMVNSAAYGFQRQISSIQHGIMILGFNTVRGLVLSASIFKLFEGKAQGLDHQKFWEHSLGTAMAARVVGAALRLGDMDDAFSAGMLHDIGKVVLDVYFSQDYQRVLEHARVQGLAPHGPGFLELEQALLKTDHTAIGTYLASKWKLPNSITEVIQYHHAPELAQNSQQLVYLVALANRLAIAQYEHGGVLDESQFPPALLEYFDLDMDDIAAFLQMLGEDMESAEALLHSISRIS